MVWSVSTTRGIVECDQSHGFAHADDFYQYMRDAFGLLHEEGAEHPKPCPSACTIA